MVLGKLSKLGRPANLVIEGQGPAVLAVGVDRGCLDIFFSCLSFLFFFPLSGRRPDID